MNSNLNITKGNITTASTGAIVNAANDRLAEGGGVCGAIFGAVNRVGGHAKLTAACKAIGHCPTGDAVITHSFGLPAPWIIHAVGPKWRGDRNELPTHLSADNITQLRELASAYRAVLRVCWENGIRSVTIPGISTGIYGLPKELGGAIAVAVCSTEASDIDVTLVAYDSESYEGLRNAPDPGATALLAGNGIID